MSNERVNNAVDIALDMLETIEKVVETPDYVQVVGTMGGDYITYRIFDDGRIYEK